jgi:4-hydroxy-tetrahydrodipicolinate synthase
MTKLPEGLWPVMLTPFKENNQLDLDGLRKLTDLYLESGANGMFANCLSSEMFQLTDEERLNITRTVVKHCEGKVPVAATGTFSDDVDENVDFIKRIYDTGVAAVIIITSVIVDINKGEDAFKQKLEGIISKTGDIPLGLYECPVPYKRLVSPEIMKWLAESGRFLYHKDTSCDKNNISQKLAVIKDTGFQLYNADTPTALDSLKDGAKGISPISGNFYPEFYGHFLKEYYLKGVTPELEKLSDLLIVMDAVTHNFYPWSAKLFLQKRGLPIAANTRLPFPGMAVKDINQQNALMKVFDYVTETFGIELKL